MTPSSAFKIKTLAVSAALACAGLVGTAQAETTVRLGFAAPLTGPQAHYGEDMRKGFSRPDRCNPRNEGHACNRPL